MKEMIPVDLHHPSGRTEPATLDHPLEHLVACHRRIEDKLSVLERALAHLEDETEEALYACHSVCTFLDSSGALYSEDEEESVFPRVRLQATTQELAYLDKLELQHREAEGYIARLRNLTKQLERDPAVPATREALARTGRKLVALYRAHLASENEVLATIGHARLDDLALAEIAFEMRIRRSRGV